MKTGESGVKWRAFEIEAHGVRLAAYCAGSEAPDARTVLLLHGLGQWTDAAWGPLLPLLDPGLRYVAFDLPGFGASAKPAAAYSLAFFRALLDDAVTALGLARFAVVGHSLGGALAADYAGRNAQRVERLALFAPAAFARPARYLIYAMFGGVGRFVALRPPSRRFVRWALSRAVYDPHILSDAYIDGTLAHAREPGSTRAFAGVYAGAVRALLDVRTLHAGFARFRGPVFCAWGVDDRFLSVRGLRRVERIYPQAEILRMPRCGHLPMIEHPRESAAALRAFLA
jgi:pimeloyl-ACP methyl ester carboxylesterase